VDFYCLWVEAYVIQHLYQVTAAYTYNNRLYFSETFIRPKKKQKIDRTFDLDHFAFGLDQGFPTCGPRSRFGKNGEKELN
jgi:hypothetical protein